MVPRLIVFARAAIGLSGVPLVVAAAVGLWLLSAEWAWRAAIRRAAEVGGADPVALVAAFPLDRVCADPALAFADCDAIAGGRWLLAGACLVIAILVAWLTALGWQARGLGADRARQAEAAGRWLRLSSVTTVIVLVVFATAVHLGARGLPARSAGAVRALAWIACAAGVVRLAWEMRRQGEIVPPALAAVRVDVADAPRLLALIADVGGQLGVVAPDHVVICPDHHCFVTSGPVECEGER